MDLTHYILRPCMPLPADAVAALGLFGVDRPGRVEYTWATLTDAERERLWELFPPTVTVVQFAGVDAEFIAVATTEYEARAAVVAAWRAHAEELGISPDYPAGDECNAFTGTLGSVWRDGSLYPKGSN